MDREKKIYIGSKDGQCEDFIRLKISEKSKRKLRFSKGLPYQDESVHHIVSEHILEHLSREGTIRFLEECYRVLQPGGTCQVVTLDLDTLVFDDPRDQRFSERCLASPHPSWIQNRCMMRNLTPCECDYKYIFNYEDLEMIGKLAGFLIHKRSSLKENGFQSGEPDHVLAVEFIKENDHHLDALPLVSILIPAYHASFFKEALSSAISQTYQNIEIIVCNDNPSSDIRNIVENIPERKKMRYLENPKNMGAALNYLKCFELAQGTYIKFLNDDDLLGPDCVKRMVACFEAFGERVTLVTSKRNKIDHMGSIIKDDIATASLVDADAYIDGKDLGNLILLNHVNMVGEPTTAMFRKKDLMDLEPSIFSIGGQECIYVVDVVMWLNLLSKGDAVYISEPLSSFRIHGNQDQQKPAIMYKCISAWPQILNGARSLGFLEKGPECIQAIKTFSRICRGWEEKPHFNESQRRGLSELRVEMESQIPSLERDAQSFSGKRALKKKYAKQLKDIRKQDGWNGALKYIYVKGK